MTGHRETRLLIAAHWLPPLFRGSLLFSKFKEAPAMEPPGPF